MVLEFSCLLFFFFQAEDGIRDRNVTGVQTCALPICLADQHERDLEAEYPLMLISEAPRFSQLCQALRERRAPRSEERRVGKECRSRWWREYESKKRGTACQREVCEYGECRT